MQHSESQSGHSTTRQSALPGDYTFLDLEARDEQIFQIGAIRGGAEFHRQGKFDRDEALAALDQFAAGSEAIAGHNLIGHDCPTLQAIAPGLGLLQMPVIDTLYLSPLAFPENPYHALIKDYKLVKDAVNNPVADARLAAHILNDEWLSFGSTAAHGNGELLSFYRFAFVNRPQAGTAMSAEGMGRFFETCGAQPVHMAEAKTIFESATRGSVCQTAARNLLGQLSPQDDWLSLAYALAWLKVSGSKSVLPAWVRKQFKNIAGILNQLREEPCQDPACQYCASTHAPSEQLKRYFGFPAFRPKPAAPDGSSLQAMIVRKGLGNQPILAILPTGGGKSLCYQLPALVRNFRRGVLTIVISPLQALMKDQVDNLTAKTGSPAVAAIYGLLTPPERGDALERVRLGDVAVLYVSPEQLRNKSFSDTIAQREIGCWVFDEAHCLSKWGHDFRPDYLYASRFIREFAQEQEVAVPPIACFTATAKRDVIQDIVQHFQNELGQMLEVFDGGSERDNLRFEVHPITAPERHPRLHELLSERLGAAGSAIVYAATRRSAEETAQFLGRRGWNAKAFHGGLTAADKREIQDGFIRGSVRVICATNAFGMGIDKEDVRVVVHAEIPGSLENYLQEAGRAGRDTQPAECLLLFSQKDLETQFSLASRSRLTQRDIAQILRAVRRTKLHKQNNFIVVTPGELLSHEDMDASFDAQDSMADTKVKTALAWLERSQFLERNENRTNVFQGKPVVVSMEEADKTMARLNLAPRAREQWRAVLRELMNADGANEGLNADQLAQLSVFRNEKTSDGNEQETETASRQVIRILHEMSEAGLVKQGVLLSAFVRYKIADSSKDRLARASEVEREMLILMQERAPDADGGEWQHLSLREINQALIDQGSDSSVALLRNLLTSLNRDGKGSESHPSLEVRHCFGEHYKVKFRRSWTDVLETSRRRRALAEVILDAILAKIPPKTAAGADLLIEFSSEELVEAIRGDITLASQIRDMLKAIDRGLMYLHEQKVVILQHGLSVFLPAMTLRLFPEANGRRYTKGDFSPLARHYDERVLQIHVMNEYAKRGLESIPRSLELVHSYFHDTRAEFLRRHLSGQDEVVKRAISQEGYQQIVDQLRNPVQIAVVAAPEDENMLILAGPGSGKTRAVVHRVAYLVRVRRVRPRGILVLCFNRQAKMELQTRLRAMIDDDAAHVTVQTYHGLAMRLMGRSFVTQAGDEDAQTLDFEEVILSATRLLRGEQSLPGVEDDELRDRLLAGYQYILVDEYQDIDDKQYDLISALAGRTGKDPDQKLTILAVGDDDQNIYGFRGANIEFIRRFEQDYKAQCHYMVENYRSTANIIAAANAVIALNRDRMKTGHPIQIGRTLADAPAGGDWETLDPVGRGKVQIIRVGDQRLEAGAVADELRRLHGLAPHSDWSSFAVLTRTRDSLHHIRAACEFHGIPVRWTLPPDRLPKKLNRIREFARFLDRLSEHRNEDYTASVLLGWAESMYPASADNPWVAELQALLRAWREDTADQSLPCGQVIDYMYQALTEQRRNQSIGRGIFLSTIHSAKGTEFDHVLMPAEGWYFKSTPAEQEEERRAFYVGMSRARKTLTIFRSNGAASYADVLNGEYVLRRSAGPGRPLPSELQSRQYELLKVKDMFIDFSADYPDTDPIHAALEQLQPGSTLRARRSKAWIELINGDGHLVARLSKAGSRRWIDRLESIHEIRRNLPPVK